MVWKRAVRLRTVDGPRSQSPVSRNFTADEYLRVLETKRKVGLVTHALNNDLKTSKARVLPFKHISISMSRMKRVGLGLRLSSYPLGRTLNFSELSLTDQSRAKPRFIFLSCELTWSGSIDLRL